MKINKAKLAQIVQEELQAVTAEGYKAYKRDDMDTLEAHMLGRKHALEVSQGEREDSDIMMMGNAAYRAGFEDATEEMAIEAGESDSWDDEGGSDTDDSLNPDEPEGGDYDWWGEGKITKSKLAQIVQEEMNNVLEEADIASLQKELMAAVGAIVDAYEGIKLPPPVAALKDMVDEGNLLQAHHDIVDMWNELLMYHQDSGIRMPSFAVVTNFNAVNKLLRKVPDSVGGQVGQRTPQRPIDRDEHGNRIPVYEENSAEVDRVVSNMLQRDMTREELELLRMKLDDMIRQLSGDEEESAMALEGISKWINSKLNPKRPEATNPQRSEQAKEAWRQRGVRDAEDAMHISGDYSESPSSDDEDYMAGWNSALQKGTNEIKITKSKLAQIIQEELKATLSEYSDTEYDPYWDEKAEEDARDEALWSAIDELLVDLEDTPVPIRELIPPAPEGVTDIDWNEAGEEYLLGLVEAGDVVRVEGSPNDDWNGEEAELYVLAPR